MLKSAVCRYDHFLSDWYRDAGAALGIQPGVSRDVHTSYRKLWEWCAIFEILSARGMLKPGRTGLGFAVGTEPLASALANQGPGILATDLAVGKAPAKWTQSNQHASSLAGLYHEGLISRDRFSENVRFQPADMRNLSGFDSDQFDFIWSSCAFEHIGTLDDGLDFVKNAMRLVKPGGVAVHTTEYNVSSNTDTTRSVDCIYRKQDIEKLGYDLRVLGCGLETVDFDCGTHEFDLVYDRPPYFKSAARHIKLLLDGYVSTSMVLAIRKF